MQAIKKLLTNLYTKRHEQSIDLYFEEETNVLNIAFVKSIMHLKPKHIQTMLREWLFANPPRTVGQIVKEETISIFDINNVTYEYLGKQKQKNEFGEVVEVPIFKNFSTREIVELPLDLEIVREF